MSGAGAMTMAGGGDDDDDVGGGTSSFDVVMSRSAYQHDHQDASLAAAADIIRTLDNAFSQMKSSALTAGNESEEARRNARAASEIARRYQQGQRGEDSSSSSSSSSIMDFGFSSPPSLQPPTRPYYPTASSKYAAYSSPQLRAVGGAGGAANVVLGMKRMSPGVVHKFGNKTIRRDTPLDRGDRSSAEEMLSLSLELERSNRSWETEQLAHDETRAALSKANAKNEKLQNQIEKLLDDMETQRESGGRKIDSLEEDLVRARSRVESAEEDAQQALDIAKSEAERRVQLEELLRASLEQVDQLKDDIARLQASSNGGAAAAASASKPQQQKRTVRFADQPTFFDESNSNAPAPSRPSRSIVAVGRQLLQRSLAPDDDDDKVHSVSQKAAKTGKNRRFQRISGKLLKSASGSSEGGGTEGVAAPPDEAGPIPPPPPRKELYSSAEEALDVCRSAAIVLKESGKRLNLSGRWWSDNHASGGPGTTNSISDDIHVDILARHYCTSVELKLNEKQKEIVELESLCALWEQGENNFPGNDEDAALD